MVWDPVWDKIFASRPWGKYPAEELIRFVAGNFYAAPERARVKLLELGCGTGANLWYIAREGFGFTGVDGSPTAIDIARKRLDAEVPGWSERGSLQVADFMAPPVEDGAFDAAIDNEAVCCNSFDDAVVIYRKAAQAVRPGGKIFVRTFATGTWGEGTGEKLGRNAWACTVGPIANTGYARFTDRDEIPELLSGFTIRSIDMLSRTVGGTENVIREWIIVGEKPA